MRLYKVNSTLDAPNNFPLAYRRPQLNNNIIIQYRQFDTIRQGGGYAIILFRRLLYYKSHESRNGYGREHGREAGKSYTTAMPKAFKLPFLKHSN